MAKKKSVDKKNSNNGFNRNLVIGVVVLLVAFLLVMNFSGDGESEDGLGTIGPGPLGGLFGELFVGDDKEEELGIIFCKSFDDDECCDEEKDEYVNNGESCTDDNFGYEGTCLEGICVEEGPEGAEEEIPEDPIEKNPGSTGIACSSHADCDSEYDPSNPSIYPNCMHCFGGECRIKQGHSVLCRPTVVTTECSEDVSQVLEVRTVSSCGAGDCVDTTTYEIVKEMCRDDEICTWDFSNEDYKCA